MCVSTSYPTLIGGNERYGLPVQLATYCSAFLAKSLDWVLMDTDPRIQEMLISIPQMGLWLDYSLNKKPLKTGLFAFQRLTLQGSFVPLNAGLF